MAPSWRSLDPSGGRTLSDLLTLSSISNKIWASLTHRCSILCVQDSVSWVFRRDELCAARNAFKLPLPQEATSIKNLALGGKFHQLLRVKRFMKTWISRNPFKYRSCKPPSSTAPLILSDQRFRSPLLPLPTRLLCPFDAVSFWMPECHTNLFCFLLIWPTLVFSIYHVAHNYSNLLDLPTFFLPTPHIQCRNHWGSFYKLASIWAFSIPSFNPWLKNYCVASTLFKTSSTHDFSVITSNPPPLMSCAHAPTGITIFLRNHSDYTQPKKCDNTGAYLSQPCHDLSYSSGRKPLPA
jgi:hypothetical protein